MSPQNSGKNPNTSPNGRALFASLERLQQSHGYQALLGPCGPPRAVLSYERTSSTLSPPSASSESCPYTPLPIYGIDSFLADRRDSSRSILNTPSPFSKCVLDSSRSDALPKDETQLVIDAAEALMLIGRPPNSLPRQAEETQTCQAEFHSKFIERLYSSDTDSETEQDDDVLLSPPVVNTSTGHSTNKKTRTRAKRSVVAAASVTPAVASRASRRRTRPAQAASDGLVKSPNAAPATRRSSGVTGAVSSVTPAGGRRTSNANRTTVAVTPTKRRRSTQSTLELDESPSRPSKRPKKISPEAAASRDWCQIIKAMETDRLPHFWPDRRHFVGPMPTDLPGLPSCHKSRRAVFDVNHPTLSVSEQEFLGILGGRVSEALYQDCKRRIFVCHRWRTEEDGLTHNIESSQQVCKVDVKVAGALHRWFESLHLFDHAWNVADKTRRPANMSVLLRSTHGRNGRFSEKKQLNEPALVPDKVDCATCGE